MGRSKEFEPGEIAVLLHSNGGRIMIVHEVTKDGVIERVEPSQQKYVDARRFHWVLKVEKPERAYELIGRFKQIDKQYDAAVRAAKQAVQKAYKDAEDDYEVWVDDDEEGIEQ